jgi:hypothetical protein
MVSWCHGGEKGKGLNHQGTKCTKVGGRAACIPSCHGVMVVKRRWIEPPRHQEHQGRIFPNRDVGLLTANAVHLASVLDFDHGSHGCARMHTQNAELIHGLFRMAARKHKRRKNPVQSGLLIVPLFVLAITASPAKASSNLLENSPFLPPDAAVRAAQQTAPLELRSIVKEGGQYEFSLYDPAKKQSTWIRLNEPGTEFLVKAFDPANNIVTVEQHSRVYTLTLKEARIALLSVSPAAPPSGSGPGKPNGGETQQVAKNELSPAQIRLLEHLREVKRQREAARPPPALPGQQSPEDD